MKQQLPHEGYADVARETRRGSPPQASRTGCGDFEWEKKTKE